MTREPGSWWLGTGSSMGCWNITWLDPTYYCSDHYGEMWKGMGCCVLDGGGGLSLVKACLSMSSAYRHLRVSASFWFAV